MRPRPARESVPSSQRGKRAGGTPGVRVGNRGCIALPASSDTPLSIGFVSTYPPTKCGLATFTASLAGSLELDADDIGVVSCVEEADTLVHPEDVVAEWVRGSEESLENAADVLNRYDAVVIQHEFGIFGGADGEDVLQLLARLEVPVIVVLHTVLPNPSHNQRMIIECLPPPPTASSRRARSPARGSSPAHDVDPDRVVVIQHGAHANLAPRASAREPTARPVILTWGLIGPGKGSSTRSTPSRSSATSTRGPST